MWAVANHHAQVTLPPHRTTTKVGITITGQARQKVATVTNRVSPAPRRAKANVVLTALASEKAAAHTSRPGTIASTAAKSAAQAGDAGPASPCSPKRGVANCPQTGSGAD